MKLAGVPITGKRRNAWTLMAGIGTAAAMVLAPIAVGVVQAGQAGASTGTSGTTIVTSSKATGWTATSTSPTYKTAINADQATTVCQGPAQAAVPGSTLTAVTPVTWLWATVGQAHCTNTTKRPPDVPNGTVTLTKTFTVTGIPQASTLYIAADDWASVSINGTTVTLSALMSTTATTHNTNYKTVHTATVSTLLRQGPNTITITASNTGNPVTGASGAANPAGVGLYLPITWTTTTANLCKKTGWRDWTTTPGPFQNQGDCVSYFVHNPSAADPTLPNTASS